MSCSSCQKNKEIQSMKRPRINVGEQNSSPQPVQNKTQPIASPKFQTPRVLPPIK